MIKNIIDLLQRGEYYNETKRIDIAKGKYQIPHTWKQVRNTMKRM